MSEANAVATRLPEFSQHEPLIWFRRAETRFRLRGIKQATTRADYVLEALAETIFMRIGPWLDQQPDEIPYDDLKKHLLKEFSPTTSERARRLLLMPSQPIGDRKPSQLWDEICMLSRLPETDEDSKNKEVDLKKEIWLQTLPSCVRVFQMRSPWMIFLHWQMRLLNQLARLCSQNTAVSGQNYCKWLKMHSWRWKRWEYVPKLQAPGSHLST